MRRIRRYDMLKQEWTNIWELLGPTDIEWQQLKSLGIKRLFELATQPEYSEMSGLAAEVMMLEYPEAQETSDLVWFLSRDPRRYWLIGFAQDRLFQPIHEQIAFASADVPLEARSIAIDVLIHNQFDFTPYKRTLREYLSSEDRSLQISAAAALALTGSREGERLLADTLPQTKFYGEVLSLIEMVYFNCIYKSKPFPTNIENSLVKCLENFIQNNYEYDLYFIENILEILLSKKLRMNSYKFLINFLKEISKHRRYWGLLVVLRSYMLDQPYETPDGKRWKSLRKPHPSNRKLLSLIEEAIDKQA
jgi:hypothetical protein